MVFMSAVAQGTEITTCNFDKSAYNQGDTGFITVTIYNDQEAKIRVTELTAAIDYFYNDENLYIQTFYADIDEPVEIQRGQSGVLYIPFSLPTNIAPGFTELYVKAVTEVWNNMSEYWFQSSHPTYRPTIFIESPYKEQSEEQQIVNDVLRDDLDEMQAINTTTTTLMYLFGGTTLIFALATAVVVFLQRRASGMS